MEAYLSNVPALIKAIQSLQLSRINKKNGEGQFLSCNISAQGIKLSNCTISKDVYCCCWLRKDAFKKYEYFLDATRDVGFDVCLSTLLNCIQVFGQDAKMVVLTYDEINLNLSITDEEGATTDCKICTYHLSESIEDPFKFNIEIQNTINLNMDYVIMFPNVLKDLLKDLCDIGKPETKMKLELHPQCTNEPCMMSFSCSVEGEECLWEFSDDHNVFTGSKINRPHSYLYFIKSISQLEKSLNVCSMLRLKIGDNGLLIVQMVIKSDIHIFSKDSSYIRAENDNSEHKDKKNQVFNTEFAIFPVNYGQ